MTPSRLRSPKDKPSPGATRGSATDPARHLLPDQRQALRALFAPARVAVVGATEKEGSVGRTLLWNLITHPFGGTVFPVNPKHASLLGVKAYPDLASLPEPADLAVVVTPAPTVPAVIADCVRAGVKGAIVISAGFKETGAAGAELERQVLAEARRGRLRIIGPNCLGVMNPLTGLNATFASAMARPGNVAFLSQSGALCTAVLDWSLRENVGFSLFVSVGSMLDVSWGDLILHVGDDPRTQAVLIYMESIGDARAFLSAAREVALSKPIIVIKPGRTEGAARAAASHTGALAGRDDVLEAAFRRCGVLRVESIAELFYAAESLAKQPRPRGPRLAIVTNAGGPAVLATDVLLLRGGQLAALSPETLEALDRLLPPAWSHANPVDVLGDADPARYARAVEIVAADPGSDGLLVILTPQAMTDPTRTAEELKPHARLTGKPLLASWMGGAEVAAGESILNRASIPTFPYPDTAARMFTTMWRYAENLRLLYETPAPATGAAVDRPEAAGALLESARHAGRTLLTEAESKQLLAAYGIPTVPTRVATDPAAAQRAAAELGFPAVLKLHSETITHKSDVDGVRLNLPDAAAVGSAWRDIEAAVARHAGPGHFQGVTVQPMVSLEGYELIVGSSLDPQFGPVLLFGTGGRLVEVFRDRALGLPPLTSTLARRLMEQTRIYRALQGVRGQPPVDLARLEQLLVRVSQLVVEQPRIKELDINPLLASGERLLALDARVVLHAPEIPDSELPQPAIRPYPRQYQWEWRPRDGSQLTIRPIRPEDEPLIAAFHGTLSDRSVYMRYLHPIALHHRIAHERLARICIVDYDREIVLVAEEAGAAGDGRRIVGVGRLTKLHWSEEAEFALLVSDRFQRRGLGTELLRRIVEVGRGERLRRIVGYISTENTQMLQLARRLGFRAASLAEDRSVFEATLDL
ncbi:MAG: bifunctional acetate--CoA ligase family protein/GNAT family N-acetyltransferase [Candidatus Rokubacteria bacterium]|nr:bifunctional acetate--CoA ligase family protein/GNAT family N-acetyltransferase [Candidatus Rokubacteria bacterium]